MAVSRESFVLRGVGRSAFPFTETVEMRLVPVYVYDDVLWASFKDSAEY